MCILFFAIEQHPKYPLIICANRDEFHQRSTQAMHWWPTRKNKSNILAGKDLQAGGTWLGLNAQGKFSALTNFRQPQSFDNEKQSRGDLVLQALNMNNNDITDLLTKSAKNYNAFNLVFGKLGELCCFDSTTNKLLALTPGFHSLCNGALDDIWPKMALGESKLTETIHHSSEGTLNINELFTIMQDNQQASLKSLPKTGLSVDFEQLLSSIFIVSHNYGTRTTNIITQDNDGNISIYDRSFNEHGKCFKKQNFSIKL